MRYRVLACDYDGTLAAAGRIDDTTAAALARLRESGRRLFMVTGRELDDLLSVCPQIGLFDLVVAENGALLYDPSRGQAKLLAEAPPGSFVNLLRQRGVSPLSVGRSIVATLQPYDTLALDTIRDLGLELQVILNKGSVMILPAGVNKATGLLKALEAQGLSPRNAVAIGDAENDHALLGAVEFGVAVSNALPALRERADLVTAGGFGHGVQELIGLMLDDDLAALEDRLARRQLILGRDEHGRDVPLSPYGHSLAIVTPSQQVWPAAATKLLAQLAEGGYQTCALSNAGPPQNEATVVLGSHERAPSSDEIVKALESPATNLAADLSAVASNEWPRCLGDLLSRLAALRAKTSRPHWIIAPLPCAGAELQAAIEKEPELRQGVAWIVNDEAAIPTSVQYVLRSGSPSSNGSGCVVTNRAAGREPTGVEFPA